MMENGGSHLAAHLHSSRRQNVLQFKVWRRILRWQSSGYRSGRGATADSLFSAVLHRMRLSVADKADTFTRLQPTAEVIRRPVASFRSHRRGLGTSGQLCANGMTWWHVTK